MPADPNDALPEDLLALTASMVGQASESRAEGPFVDWLETELRGLAHLTVERVGDNLVARTEQGCAQRVVLAGHTDTVPANGNATPRIEGDTLWGVGSTDMKGGLAIQLAPLRSVPVTAVDLSYVFYAREEVAAAESGLGELFALRPDLVTGDVAIIGEPTDGKVEAGCQGTMRVQITLRGERAHTARPWMGRNAVHRLGEVLRRVEAADVRRPTIDSLEFREALQAVAVTGGVAANVVPDVATVTLNHRFAPDRSPADAEAFLRSVLDEVLEDGDTFEVVDAAAGALPGLSNPLIAAFVGRADLPVTAKLGWTDVALRGARYSGGELRAGLSRLGTRSRGATRALPSGMVLLVLRALVTQGF